MQPEPKQHDEQQNPDKAQLEAIAQKQKEQDAVIADHGQKLDRILEALYPKPKPPAKVVARKLRGL